MRIVSYNTLFGGFDGADDRRYRLQLDVLRSEAADILLLQEARPYLAQGGQLLHATETALGMRGFVAEAPTTGQHTAVFIRPELTPLSFESDHAHFHHATATLRVKVPGLDRPVCAVSVHLCPNSPHARLREVSYLFNHADPEALTLIAGDFNSISPDDPEPEGLPELPARYRMRYTGGGGKSDRQTISELIRCGLVDVGRRFDQGPVPTVPGAAFPNTEFVPFRSDYVFASAALAKLATGYGVIRNELTDAASDHYPVWAEFTSQV